MGMFELLCRSIIRRGLFGTLRYLFYEFRFDYKYGTETRPEKTSYDFEYLNSSNYQAPCQGANPWVVNACFDELKRLGVAPNQSTFLDYGSGKGRVVLMAAMAGFRRVIGVEMIPALCETTLQNLNVNPALFNREQIVLCNENAATYTPPTSINVVFLYNPFGCDLMRTVIRNLLQSFRTSRRSIFVVYVNPVHSQVLSECGLKSISEVLGEAQIFKVE